MEPTIALQCVTKSFESLTYNRTSRAASSQLKTYRPHIHLYHSIWTADYQNKEVCQAQVEEEQVCGGPHGLGREDNDQDQHIPDDPDSEDQAAHDITLLLNIKHNY